MPSLSQGEEGTEKHRLYQLPRMVRSQTGDSRCFQKVGAKSENFKEGVEVAEEVLSRILSVKANGTEGHFSMKKWESEKHRKLGSCEQKASRWRTAPCYSWQVESMWLAVWCIIGQR